jgi:hypothetical protein
MTAAFFAPQFFVEKGSFQTWLADLAAYHCTFMGKIFGNLKKFVLKMCLTIIS